MANKFELSYVKEMLQKQSKTKKIVLCHGVFDVIHPGHISHLSEAKSLGDLLVVTVTSDVFVNKGPGRPVQSATSRAEILISLKMVDYVAISEFPTALEVINYIKPKIYVKGADYANASNDITGQIIKEKAAVESLGGRMHFTSTPIMSSSKLINDSNLGTSNYISEYLRKIRNLYSEGFLQAVKSDLQDVKVLVLGEAIIDEYLTCEALGKSSKDPVLVFREGPIERQLGGSLAIANHCANLGAQVTLLTKIGDSEADRDLIASKLNSDITSRLIISQTDPTIIKRRYIDSLTQFRVFETYVMGDINNNKKDVEQQIKNYEEVCNHVDLVIICDYGHGFMAPEFINSITSSSAKLAINTQVNAGNKGLNSISKYDRVDFLSLNGGEVGLELKIHNLQMDQLLPDLIFRSGAKRVLVTEGEKGLALAEEREITHAPALAVKVVDRVGAGDAVFATASLLFALDKDLELTGFLANLAGAIAISDLGNRKTVDSINLFKHAIALTR